MTRRRNSVLAQLILIWTIPLSVDAQPLGDRGPTRAELLSELGRTADNDRTVAILDTLGRDEFATARYSDAKKYFLRELAVSSLTGTRRAVALANLSQACLALGESRLAETYAREGLKLYDVPQLWQRLGQALLVQGKLDEAEPAYREALKGAPNDAEAWSDLAAIVARRGGQKEAVTLLRHALTLNSKGQVGGRILRNLAVCEWKVGDREPAVEHLGRAVELLEAALGPLHPDVAVALADYADVLAKTGQKRQARAAADRARDIQKSFSSHSGAGSVDWRELSTKR